MNHMNDEAFADLRDAMEDAVAFERGQCRDLKITRIQALTSEESSALGEAPVADRNEQRQGQGQS
jgi:hypothetical protein